MVPANKNILFCFFAAIYCVFVFKKIAGVAESNTESPTASKRKPDERTSHEEPKEKTPKIGE